MKEPYDDSQPFPPEWEGEDENRPEMPEELKEILRSLAGGMAGMGIPAEIRVQQARQEWRKCLDTFGQLALEGCGSMEVLTSRPSMDDQGFHAAIHVNASKEHIENAGLTVEEVREVWNIYAGCLQDFYESIKAKLIENGFGEDGI